MDFALGAFVLHGITRDVMLFSRGIVEQCGPANGSEPFTHGDRSNALCGWFPPLTFAVGNTMSTLHYHSGEAVMKGDRVHLSADEGRVIHIGDELKEWGLSKKDREGRVMIECRSMALVCEFADSEDLIFVSRADTNPK